MLANPYPRQIFGLENIPIKGPFVLLINHYDRPSLHVYHCAMLISAIVRERRPEEPELRWAYISEHTERKAGLIPIPVSLTRMIFRRVAAMYDLVVLPRREELVVGRAAALRRLLRDLEAAPVGMAPEGRGQGRLLYPPKGAGLFLSSLSRRGFSFLPVGIWEEEETLFISFGEMFRITVPSGLSRDDEDRLSSETAMSSIGRLLPPDYWGAYEDPINRSLAPFG